MKKEKWRRKVEGREGSDVKGVRNAGGPGHSGGGAAGAGTEKREGERGGREREREDERVIQSVRDGQAIGWRRRHVRRRSRGVGRSLAVAPRRWRRCSRVREEE